MTTDAPLDPATLQAAVALLATTDLDDAHARADPAERHAVRAAILGESIPPAAPPRQA